MHRQRFFLQHSSSAAVLDIYDVDPEVVGKGGFGTVRKGTLKSAPGVTRAIKTVHKRNLRETNLVRREVAILRSLDHPYICRIYETFDEGKWTHFVMEFVEGEDLFNFIEESITKNTLHMPLIREIMRQLFSGLHYCHERGIVHRDVKPENIMVLKASNRSKPRIKLIDFGLASKLQPCEKGLSSHFVGTFDYLPPEAQTGRTRCEPSMDMWSAGMVMHALLCGGLPDSVVRTGAEPFDPSDEAYGNVPSNAMQLLLGLLEPTPNRRMAALEAWQQCSGGWGTEDGGTGGVGEQFLGNAAKAFVNFHRAEVLRRAVFTAIATQCATADFAEISREFIAMDKDKNGRVSRKEMAEAIAHHLPVELSADTEHWMLSIFDALDTDGSDEIEYSEYLAGVVHEAGARCEETMKAAFRVFDIDRSGKISVGEFERVVAMSAEEIKEHMLHFDCDTDGEINFEEFRQMFGAGKESSLRIARSASFLQDKMVSPLQEALVRRTFSAPKRVGTMRLYSL